MNKNDFLNALKEFANDCNAELIPKGNDWYELKPHGDPTSRMYVLKLNLTPNGDNVSEIHYRILCGEVRDPNALPMILRRNYGGVMETEFFFSATLVDGRMYLFLETRLSIDANIDDKEEVFGILGTMWIHPLFIMEWDFPKGVINYLW
jgi:hypothetical protein